MKRTLLALSVAAAVTVSGAPLPAHAAGLSVTNVDRNRAKQWIVIKEEETGKEILKTLLKNCGVDWSFLFWDICPTIPGETLPDNPKPETNVPEESEPETEAPKPEIPETETPETEPETVPETKPPVTEKPESKPPVTVPEESIPEESAPEEETTQPSKEVHPYVLRIVELVNEERAKAGLDPVILDSAATRAAQIRAKEIVSRFSHTRPNGTSFSTALKEQGISYRSSGENIAWGQRSPEAVMEAWMNSSGHRANILKASFTHIGVGYYEQNGVKYWSQLFFR